MQATLDTEKSKQAGVDKSIAVDEYNLRKTFRCLEWLATALVAGYQGLWALAIVSFDPCVQVSYSLLGLSVLISFFSPRTTKWWYIQLASQILLISFAGALGARQYYYVLLYVYAAKAALILPKRQLFWFGCAITILHVVATQYALYELRSLHPHHHRMPGYYRQLVLEPEADLYFMLSMLSVTFLGRTLANERVSRARERELAQEVEAMAVLVERDRIARDIHDGLGHSLNASKIQLERALLQLENNQLEGVPELLNKCHKAARSSLLEVRRAARTTMNEQFNFKKAAEALLEQISEEETLKFTVQLDDITLSQKVQHQLFYIIQESLNNVRKHSEATHVEITMKKHSDLVVLCIKDNGKGFDTNASQEGYGRKGLAERAEKIGGTIECHSSQGNGTEIVVKISAGNA